MNNPPPPYSEQGNVYQPWMQPPPPLTCTGKKKALLIGINYFYQPDRLAGSISDVMSLKRFLMDRYGFQEGPDKMVVLTDDQQDPSFVPTRHNITTAMRWLVSDARPGDILFFHFSGHGSQVKDYEGDEADGYDETILPVDHHVSGQITDDEMHNIMARPLPAGVRLIAVFDCCHSGTALDLPYQYLPDGRLKKKDLMAHASSTAHHITDSLMKGRLGNAGMALMQGLSNVPNVHRAKRFTEQYNTTMADVISISACKDRQNSADVHAVGYGATGALVHAFIMSLYAYPRPTHGQLLGSIRNILSTQHSQTPQFSSGRKMDMNQCFIL